MTPASEEWRPVPGWEGLYEVSDHGRVRSIERIVYAGQGRYRRQFAKVLTTSRHNTYDGRRIIGLFRDGRGTTYRVASLVLTAFVGPRPPGMEACHNDGDPSNDRLENLRWDTHSANICDKARHGTDHNASKTRCPRGHALAEPNLTRCEKASGRRSCLACSRGRATVQQGRKRGRVLDLNHESHAHYAHIMKGTQWAGTG